MNFELLKVKDGMMGFNSSFKLYFSQWHSKSVILTNGTFLNGIKLKPGIPYNLNLKDQVQLAGVSGIIISVGSESTESRNLDNQKNILELFKILGNNFRSII